MDMSDDAAKRYTDAMKQYADLAEQGRQNIVEAVEAWTRTAQEAFSNVPKSAGEFDLADSVDRMYDFTEKVLGMQRDFTKKLIATSTEAAESAKASFAEATKFSQPKT
jgi:hypothetical protein